MATQNTFPGKRLFFLDNLKTFIIFLVVVYHAGWVYESNGILAPFWIVVDPAKNGLAPIVGLILDMFIMPVMFLISGYFAPRSLGADSGKSFLVSRFKRLMVPWILAVLVLLPLSKVIFLYSRGMNQAGIWSYFHFTGGSPINMGWLWFLPVLFLFDMIYFLISRVKIKAIEPGMKTGVVAVFLIGVAYSFFISIFRLSGWTKTVLIDFQNERLLIYFLYFLLGVLCYRHQVFEKASGSRIPYYIVCSTIWIPMNLYVIFLVSKFVNPGNIILGLFADVLLGWIGFHLTILGMIYLLVSTFRFYINRKGAVARSLGRYSYGVYIIHYVVLGVVALVMLPAGMPSVAKYIILAVATFLFSNLLVAAYQAIKHVVQHNADAVHADGKLSAKA